MATTQQLVDASRPAAAQESLGATRAGSFGGNQTLSTIMRFHNRERLAFLEEALFSLAIQAWRDHEVVVVVQNGTDELVREIAGIVERQPWPAAPNYKVLTVEVPAGADGRSTLLTRGIAQAAGRYLAFLDDDDLVYQHGYETLIGQLAGSECAVAVGGCRTAKVQNAPGGWYVQTKETPFAWGRTRLDLIRDNFIPVHSYVIDRARVDSGDLYFDDAFPPLEDYEFLLRLCAKYEFDFSRVGTPVCEYRIHGQNSLPYDAAAPQSARDTHLRAQQLINERKKTLLCAVPASQLVELQQQIFQKEEEAHHLRLETQHLRQRLAAFEHERRSRFLLRVVWKVYEFFGRHPAVELRLSGATHYAWGKYKKLKG